ncbi:MAG TPA: DegT/DnrJ/EryC1/StrS family aminotransferase [Candidatus Dormibacteraeota bacterium]|nr:DegT/DnrJ/EryC1/StrS family aminotransferase [Candidatus Dormibacteraeota bacterium]
MGVLRKAQDEGKPAGRVPAIDLGATFTDLRQEILAAVERVLASGRYIGGPEVERLEREFAAFCDVPHAVAVSSGTDALRFALIAAGAGGGPRDEVITSPLTFIATTEAISQAGARTVFVDVDPESLTLDPGLVRKAITDRTAAIVPIHLYGQTADMGPILEMARPRALAVVEDACQAHGALYRGGAAGAGRSAGSLGDAGCFSFYPTKNLGGCGEGGMLTTARAEIAERARSLRDHGQSEKYIHAEEGYNGRLDALQAAILRVKLKRLSGWNARRRALAALYTERFKEMGLAGTALRLPVEKPWGTHVYHLYTVRVPIDARDRVRAELLEKEIETGIHYPIPLHLQACYASLGLREGSFPVAERAAREVLSLPLFPEMTDAQVERVCEALRVVLGRG